MYWCPTRTDFAVASTGPLENFKLRTNKAFRAEKIVSEYPAMRLLRTNYLFIFSYINYKPFGTLLSR